MTPRRWIAVGAASVLLVAAAFLVVDRGGLLAWAGLLLGPLLLFKALRRPSPRDAMRSVAVLAVWAFAWGATWYYVMSTWESGEVVQLELADGHIARVWVFDTIEGPVMYYDAPPEVASRLLAGTPVSMTRNDRVRHECAQASRVDALSEERVADLLGQMEAKYGRPQYRDGGLLHRTWRQARPGRRRDRADTVRVGSSHQVGRTAGAGGVRRVCRPGGGRMAETEASPDVVQGRATPLNADS